MFVPKWPSRCCPCLRPFSRPRVQRSAVDYFGTSPATLGERVATSMRCSPRTSPAAKTLGSDHPGIFSSFVGQLTDERMLDMAVLGTTSHWTSLRPISRLLYLGCRLFLVMLCALTGNTSAALLAGLALAGDTCPQESDRPPLKRETRSQVNRTRRLRLMGWFLVGA